MEESYDGLLIVNIELTSFCNKNCWMCGRRKIDRDYPNLKLAYGNMDFELLRKISDQLPPNIVVQFHNNGEPTLYPRFGEAMKLFHRQIRCLDTNGKLLLSKKDEIIDNVDTITVSTFQDDEDADEQYEILKEFLRVKGDKKPNVIIRVLGDIGEGRYNKLKDLGCIIAERILHSPMGSFKYEKKTTIPEIGVCMEMLSHPAIDIKGDVSTCVRFDPERKSVLGNLSESTLLEIWNSPKRKAWVKKHVEGKRSDIPLCAKCEFWGIPRGH